MGRERARLTPGEVTNILQLPVTELDVWGEPPIGARGDRSIALRDVFAPSRGVTPSFGPRESDYADGVHLLYMMRYEGDAAALLGRDQREVFRKALVKVGFSNDPDRRCSELNSGIPPASERRWAVWLKSAAYPSGEAAKAAEDVLKSGFDARFESLGGEFFLGDETTLLTQFSSAPGAAAFTIKAG